MDFQPKRFKKIKRIAISTSLIVSLFSVSILITGYKVFKVNNAPKKTEITYSDIHKDRIKNIEDIYNSLDKIDLKEKLPFLNKSILDFFKNIKNFDSNYLKKIKTKFEEIKTKINEFPKSLLNKLSFSNFKKYISLFKQFISFDDFNSINSLLNNLNNIKNRVLTIKNNLSKVNAKSFNLPYVNKVNNILVRLNQLENNFKRIDLDSISKLLSSTNSDSKTLNDSWEKIDTKTISDLLVKSARELSSIEAELNHKQIKSIFDYINDFSKNLKDQLDNINSYKDKIKSGLSSDLLKKLPLDKLQTLQKFIKGDNLEELQNKFKFDVGGESKNIFDILTSFASVMPNLISNKLASFFKNAALVLDENDIKIIVNNFLQTNNEIKFQLYDERNQWQPFNGDEKELKNRLTKDISPIMGEIAKIGLNYDNTSTLAMRWFVSNDLIFNWEDVVKSFQNESSGILNYLNKNKKKTIILINSILLILKRTIFNANYSEEMDIYSLSIKLFKEEIFHINYSEKKLLPLSNFLKRLKNIFGKTIGEYLNEDANFSIQKFKTWKWGREKKDFINAAFKKTKNVKEVWDKVFEDLYLLSNNLDGFFIKFFSSGQKKALDLQSKLSNLQTTIHNYYNLFTKLLKKDESNNLESFTLKSIFDKLKFINKNNINDFDWTNWAKIIKDDVFPIIKNLEESFNKDEVFFQNLITNIWNSFFNQNLSYEEIKTKIINTIKIIEPIINNEKFLTNILSFIYKISKFETKNDKWDDLIKSNLFLIIEELLNPSTHTSYDELLVFLYDVIVTDNKETRENKINQIQKYLSIFSEFLKEHNAINLIKKTNLIDDLFELQKNEFSIKSINDFLKKPNFEKDLDDLKKFIDSNEKFITNIIEKLGNNKYTYKDLKNTFNNIYLVIQPILIDKNKDVIISNLLTLLDSFINSDKDSNSIKDVLKDDKFKDLINSLDALVDNKQWLKSIFDLLKTFGVKINDKYTPEFVQKLFKEIKDIVNNIDDKSIYDDLFKILEELTKKDIKSFKDLAPIFKDKSLLNILNKLKAKPDLLNSIYNIYTLFSGKKPYSNEQLKEIFDNLYGVIQPILTNPNKNVIISNLLTLLDSFINSVKDSNSIKDVLKDDKFKDLINSLDALVDNKKWLKSIFDLLKTFGIEVSDKYNPEFVQKLFKEIKDIVNNLDDKSIYDDLFKILEELTKKDIKSFKDLKPIFKDKSLLNILNKLKAKPDLLNSIYNIYTLFSGKKSYSNKQLKEIFDNVYGVIQPILTNPNKNVIISNLLTLLDSFINSVKDSNSIKDVLKDDKFKDLINSLDGLVDNKKWLKSIFDLLKTFGVKINDKYTPEFVQKLFKEIKDIVNNIDDKSIYDDLFKILEELTKKDIKSFKDLKPIFKDKSLLNILNKLKAKPDLLNSIYNIYTLFSGKKPYSNEQLKEIFDNLYGVIQPILTNPNKNVIISNLLTLLDSFINSDKDSNSIKDVLKDDKFKDLINSLDGLVDNKKWLKSIFDLLKTFGVKINDKYTPEFVQKLFKEIKDIVNNIDDKSIYDDLFKILEELTKKDIKSFKDLKPIFKDKSLLNILNKLKAKPDLLNSIYNIYTLFSGKKPYSNEQLKEIFDNLYGVIQPILTNPNKNVIISNLLTLLDSFINSDKDSNSIKDVLKDDKFKDLINSLDALVDNKKWLKSIFDLLKTFGIEVSDKYNPEFVQKLFKEIKDIVNNLDDKSIYDDLFKILEELTKKDIKSFKDLKPIFKDKSLLNILNKLKAKPDLLNSIYNIYTLFSGKKSYSNKQLKEIFDNVYGVIQPILTNPNKNVIISNLLTLLDSFINSDKDSNSIKDVLKDDKFKDLINSLDALVDNKKWLKSIFDLLKTFGIEVSDKYNPEFVQKLFKEIKDIVNNLDDKSIYDDLFKILEELTKKDIKSFKDLKPIFKDKSLLNILNKLKAKPDLLNSIYNIYTLFSGKKSYSNKQLKEIFDNVYGVIQPILTNPNKNVIIFNILDLLDSYVGEDKFDKFKELINSLDSLVDNKDWLKSIFDLLKTFGIEVSDKYTPEFVQKIFKGLKNIVDKHIDKLIYDDLANILNKLTKEDINSFKSLKPIFKDDSLLNLLNNIKDKPELLNDIYKLYNDSDNPKLDINKIFNKIYIVVEPILKDKNKVVIISNLLDLLDRFVNSKKMTILDLMANSSFSKLFESLFPENENKLTTNTKEYLNNIFKLEELKSYKDTYELVIKNESLLNSIIKVVKAFSGKERIQNTILKSYIDEAKVETYLKLYYKVDYNWFDKWLKKETNKITNIDDFIKERKLKKEEPEKYNHYDLIFLMTKNFLPKVANSNS